MPVHIMELVIIAKVGDDKKSDRQSATQADGGQAEQQSHLEALNVSAENILEIIKREKER